MHVEPFKVKTVWKEYYVEIITVSTKYHKFQLTSGGSVGVFTLFPKLNLFPFLSDFCVQSHSRLKLAVSVSISCWNILCDVKISQMFSWKYPKRSVDKMTLRQFFVLFFKVVFDIHIICFVLIGPTRLIDKLTVFVVFGVLFLSSLKRTKTMLSRMSVAGITYLVSGRISSEGGFHCSGHGWIVGVWFDIHDLIWFDAFVACFSRLFVRWGWGGVPCAVNDSIMCVQTPIICLQHPCSTHCPNWLCCKCPKTASFCLCSVSSKFVTMQTIQIISSCSCPVIVPGVCMFWCCV